MSEEGHEEEAPSLSSGRTFRVTLLSSEWSSTKGGVSTINRELAIQLAKFPDVEVSVYLPKCSAEDERIAASHKVRLIQAQKRFGYDPVDWLATIPRGHVMDCVISHGAQLGKQVQLIKHYHDCKWIQALHTDPEELGISKTHEEANSKGEEKLEVTLCELADLVVAIGSKLDEAFSGYLHSSGKDQNVVDLTPGIFSEFADVKQASEERKTFYVLLLGNSDSEHLAVQVAAVLKDRPLPYELKFVVASSEQEDRVKNLFFQQGISCELVCGFKEREHLPELFCEVDLAIMPSRTEGFGLPALGALSAGLPVLVNRNSGLGEALMDIPFGSQYVLHSEDPNDWALKIYNICQEKRCWRFYESRFIRQEYQKKYSWDKQCRRLVEMMLDLHSGAVDVMKCLRREYNERSLLRPLLWDETLKLPLGCFYTSLKMRQADLKLEDSEVEIYDIFNTLKKRGGFTVLVEGSLGNGKTTLCLKIAYDWANRRSHPFKVVLLLKCRYINGDILEAIHDQLLLKDEVLKKKLMNYIHDTRNQRNVLIILDGLNELPKDGECHVGRFLQEPQIFPACFILATSRQEKGEVGLNVDFDAVLQLEGLREADSFVFIRKYFRNLWPGRLSDGERIIQAVQENPLLHALNSNPLNLVFLCFVVAKHGREILSCSTKLCQIIFRYILRTFCAKHGLQVSEGDDNIEEQFQSSVMVLGNLAWKCLAEGLVSFQEKELEKLEKKYNDKRARNIGLIFKKASSMRTKPQQPQYFFVNKTCEMYLVAAYLGLTLLNNEVNIFKEFKLDFHDHVVVEYRQQFLFLSCILGERASILFTQIGEKLMSENWDWLKCNKEVGLFFTESFSETGNAKCAAKALFEFIPFPDPEAVGGTEGFHIVAKYCKNFWNSHYPVCLDVSHDTRERATQIFNDNGFIVSENQGLGNCMFYALSEQLRHVKGIETSHEKLREQSVDYLEKNPTQPEGTALSNFVYEYPTWADYLRAMKVDGKWGDHIILNAVACCFETCIEVINISNQQCCSVFINQEKDTGSHSRLLLGHIPELHYVSLQRQPGPSANEMSQPVKRTLTQSPPTNGPSANEMSQSVERKLRPSTSTNAKRRKTGPRLKDGNPSALDRRRLSSEIIGEWKNVGRELDFTEPELVGFEKDNENSFEKCHSMLLAWQRRKGSDATYEVMYKALKVVGRTDLAEKFCVSEKKLRS